MFCMVAQELPVVERVLPELGIRILPERGVQSSISNSLVLP